MGLNKEKYGQFLFGSQINYTGTYLEEHSEGVGRNAVYRFLKHSDIGFEAIWEGVKKDIIYSKNGCIILDDTVLDKSYSYDIEPVRRQYSGNAHTVIKGIGVVNCIYFNPELNRFWALDARIFDPDNDGKTKLDHVSDMLDSLVDRKVRYRHVLMDTWYATRDTMLKISDLGKIFYCPVRTNRLATEHSGESYRQVGDLQWSESELLSGKTVKFKDFQKDKLLKLFRIVVSTNQIEYVVIPFSFFNSLIIFLFLCAFLQTLVKTFF